MITFWTIYLMIGFYLAFMIYCALEDEGVNGDHIIQYLPFKLATFLSEHPNYYVLFIILVAIIIITIWPYIMYIMWRNRDEIL